MRVIGKWCLAVICLLPMTVHASGIVGSGSTSEDSVAGLAGVALTSILHIDSMQTALAGWTYVYAEAVNAIDGDGRPGTYELSFCAKDNVPKYIDCTRRTFQISEAHLSGQLASITTVLDSVLAVLDTVQNQDDWVSAATEQSIADAVWDEDTTGHAAGSFGVMLKDTAAYQGTAAGLTAAEVADSVWDKAQNEHASAGTFGAYLDSPVSAAGSPLGSGIYPVTIVAYDSGSGQAVPGARVCVYDEEINVLAAQGATASDGQIAFNLDPGRYVLSSFAPGYIFAAYDTIDVVGTGADSVFSYRFDPGNPSAPDLCRVYGFIYGVDGRPMEGVTVGAGLTGGVVRHNSLIVSPYRQTTASDTAGYFYFDLIPSNDLTPAGTMYLITASTAAGTMLNTQVAVPHASEWQLDW